MLSMKPRMESGVINSKLSGLPALALKWDRKAERVTSKPSLRFRPESGRGRPNTDSDPRVVYSFLQV